MLASLSKTEVHINSWSLFINKHDSWPHSHHPAFDRAKTGRWEALGMRLHAVQCTCTDYYVWLYDVSRNMSQVSCSFKKKVWYCRSVPNTSGVALIQSIKSSLQVKLVVLGVVTANMLAIGVQCITCILPQLQMCFGVSDKLKYYQPPSYLKCVIIPTKASLVVSLFCAPLLRTTWLHYDIIPNLSML